MTYRAVLLDLDDTILDFQGCVIDSLKTGFAQLGLGTFRPEMMDVFHQVSDSLWQGIEQGTVTFEEMKQRRFPEFLEALQIEGDGHALEEWFRRRLYASPLKLEGADDLLSALKKKGVLICAASNGPGAQQRNRLVQSGLMPYFDKLFISQEMGVRKPDPAYYDFILRKLAEDRPDLKKEEILACGDSLTSDVRGALDAGLDVCWYNPDNQKTPGGWNITHTCRRLDEINELF